LPNFSFFHQRVPLAMMGAIEGYCILVPAESSYKTVNDLVSASKANSGKLSYGYGTGSALLCSALRRIV
jgi:tripartite-type tricarboxylate transporter receptor subunit TctC